MGCENPHNHLKSTNKLKALLVVWFPLQIDLYVNNEYIHFVARKRPHEGYTSSDSEEELLRRLQMQQSSSLHSGQLSKYGAGPLNDNLSSLKHITVATHRERFNDPLGVAERGKVGLPPSSSECSSNSSADASVESNMGILHGERKGILLKWIFFPSNVNIVGIFVFLVLIRSSIDYVGCSKVIWFEFIDNDS